MTRHHCISLLLCQRFRVSADDIDGMLQAVRSDNATDGVSDHFRLLLKDALSPIPISLSKDWIHRARHTKELALVIH